MSIEFLWTSMIGGERHSWVICTMQLVPDEYFLGDPPKPEYILSKLGQAPLAAVPPFLSENPQMEI